MELEFDVIETRSIPTQRRIRRKSRPDQQVHRPQTMLGGAQLLAFRKSTMRRGDAHVRSMLVVSTVSLSENSNLSKSDLEIN